MTLKHQQTTAKQKVVCRDFIINHLQMDKTAAGCNTHNKHGTAYRTSTATNHL
jgi:hypothetical protein